MVKIDFSLLFCYYLLSGMCLYFFSQLLCGAYRWERVRGMSRQVWQCGVCLHTYFDPKPSRISGCPVCGTLNKREGREGEAA